jgi:hypothetical protein
VRIRPRTTVARAWRDHPDPSPDARSRYELGAGDEVLLVVDALAADPWSGRGLLEIKSIEPWTILLDSRSR